MKNKNFKWINFAGAVFIILAATYSNFYCIMENDKLAEEGEGKFYNLQDPDRYLNIYDAFEYKLDTMQERSPNINKISKIISDDLRHRVHHDLLY